MSNFAALILEYDGVDSEIGVFSHVESIRKGWASARSSGEKYTVVKFNRFKSYDIKCA
jgi:hypothetical protein